MFSCCKELIQIYPTLSILQQVGIYKKNLAVSSKEATKIRSLFVHPLDRFRKVLNYKERQRILRHLKKDQKTQHWMWWAFPQKTGSWGTAMVSDNTKKYSMSLDDAIRFLTFPIFLNYYQEALALLDKKTNLLYYFGSVDYQKFQSHLDLFETASQQLQLGHLNKIIQKLKKSHLKSNTGKH